MEEKKEEIELKPFAKDIASWTRQTHYDIHKMISVKELAEHISKDENSHIYKELFDAFTRYGRSPTVPINLIEGIKNLLKRSISQKE
jgi:hypothetical protein